MYAGAPATETEQMIDFHQSEFPSRFDWALALFQWLILSSFLPISFGCHATKA